MTVRIDQCVCHAQLFAHLQALAARTETTSFSGLVEEAERCGMAFGQSCGLCHPYVRAMLRDGRVVFREILVAGADDDDDDVTPLSDTIA